MNQGFHNLAKINQRRSSTNQSMNQGFNNLAKINYIKSISHQSMNQGVNNLAKINLRMLPPKVLAVGLHRVPPATLAVGLHGLPPEVLEVGLHVSKVAAVGATVDQAPYRRRPWRQPVNPTSGAFGGSLEGQIRLKI